MSTSKLALAILLVLPTARAAGDTPILLDHAANPTARIAISNVSGEVEIVGWDRPQVEVTGQLGDGAQPLAITGDAASLSIKVRAQRKSGWFNWGSNDTMGATVLHVRVPRAATLDVNVISAAVGIDGTAGGTLTIHTVSGKVRLNATTPLLKVEAVSGGIELAGHADQANLQTVSGDILAPSLGGNAELQTVSGLIHVDGGPWRQFTLSTVSGDVQVAGGVAAGGSMNIDSMSGDVQVTLPAASNASLHASTFSGSLRSDFGHVNQSQHGPGSSLDATLGNGDGKLELETFSGDLRIRRQD